MKRIIIFMLALFLVLTVVSYADEGEIAETTIADEKQDVSIPVTDGEPVTPNDEESFEDFDIQSYLTERILPVVAGVATSIVALGGTIYKIKSSLSSLNSSNESLKEIKKTVSGTLDNVKTELTKGLCEVQTKVKEIPELKESYSELKNNYSQLLKQNKALMDALKLGFEALPEAVKSGNARKIAIIAEGVADE